MKLSQRTYAQFLETLPEAALVVGQDGKIVLANQPAHNLFGYLPGELPVRSIRTLIAEESAANRLERSSGEGAEPDLTDLVQKRTARRKDGDAFPAEIMLKPVELDGAGYMLWNVHDITPTELTEASLRSKNRALVMVSQCNQLLVHAADEASLLDEFCQICVETGGYRMAWVGFAEADDRKTVRPVAQKGFEEGYLASANITWADEERGRGPTGMSIRTQQVCATRYIQTDSKLAPWATAALQRGYAASIALPLITADTVIGALTIYSSEASAFDDEEAELLRQVAADLAYGITALRLRAAHAVAEKALSESEERYHLISTVASDYMFSSQLNDSGKLTLNWTAGAFEAITGYSQAEYIAHGGWRAALYPDDLAKDDRDLDVLRANRPLVTEIRTLHKDGQIVWVRVYAHPVWGKEHAQLVGIYGAVQDITGRKRAEEIIAASEKRLSLIFDTVGDVIFLLSVEPGDCFRFVSINRAFLGVTGLRPEQVTGKRIEEVLPESSHALVISRYKRAIQENKTIRWEEESAYPNGTLLGEVAVTPYLNSDGVCTHLVGAVHDITEIRRAEQEIRKLNQELELRVAERTAKLQSLNQDLESFSYSVSHDLRAPLRAISGFATIVARRHSSSLNDEGRHYVDNIVKASERMGQLIDDLLTYSRLGRAGARHEPVPLDVALGALVNDLETRLQQIGGTLTLESELPIVRGDRTLIFQIFSNLLENAITYRKAGVPLKIIIAAQTQGEWVTVRVGDNGIGIPPEYHEKIFNIFQRLHSEDEYPGTGIGLATVKKAVELLDGRIGIESTVGEGSTFIVTLPRE